MNHVYKIIGSLKALPAKAVYALLAVLVVVFVALDFFLVMRLQLAGISAIGNRSIELKREISNLQNNKVRMHLLRQQKDDLQARCDVIQRIVHKKDDIPVILERLSTLANEYDVKIDQLAPQGMEVKPLFKAGDKEYHVQSIMVQLRAGYHDFSRFIDRLASEGAFWKIEDLVFTAGVENQKHSVKIKITVLILD